MMVMHQIIPLGQLKLSLGEHVPCEYLHFHYLSKQ